MERSLLLYNLKLNCLIFSTGPNGSLIIFIRTCTVNCRNALDILRVRMNIILLTISFYFVQLRYDNCCIVALKKHLILIDETTSILNTTV